MSFIVFSPEPEFEMTWTEIEFPSLINFQTSVTAISASSEIVLKDFTELIVIV
ncbi:hypothetical protein D3C87_2062580 [compost metagenome]